MSDYLLVEDDGQEKLYFVVETKGRLSIVTLKRNDDDKQKSTESQR